MRTRLDSSKQFIYSLILRILFAAYSGDLLYKWQKIQSNLYVGQIVIMVEPNTPRDQWKVARVESVHPDENNVRTACVRSVAGKVYERHVTKLVALELE